MEVQGSVKEILKPETFTSKTGTEFTKQTMVLTIGDTYPVDLPIEFYQDKIALLDHVKTDQQLKVYINFRSNKFNDKYYVSISGWKIEKDAAQSSQQEFAIPQTEHSDNGFSEDLPF